MCYFMHFDPILSRIQGVFQPYFWKGLEEFFRGHIFSEKSIKSILTVLRSLLLFTDPSQFSAPT